MIRFNPIHFLNFISGSGQIIQVGPFCLPLIALKARRGNSLYVCTWTLKSKDFYIVFGLKNFMIFLKFENLRIYDRYDHKIIFYLIIKTYKLNYMWQLLGLSRILSFENLKIGEFYGAQGTPKPKVTWRNPNCWQHNWIIWDVQPKNNCLTCSETKLQVLKSM